MGLTPYPDVNVLLDDLLAGIHVLLGDRLAGIYLDGSLALGSFEPDRSDVDVVVVTEGELDPGLVRRLAALHVRLVTDHPRWGHELECSYIAREALRHAPRPGPHPNVERGEGGLELVHPEAGYWVLHRSLLREHGIAVVGPAPATLIDPVTPAQLLEAVASVLREWWAPMLVDPTRLRSWGYRGYAVLTMCRMLYTLQHGTIVSKSVAAGWARASLARRWTSLIDHARAWSATTPPISTRRSPSYATRWSASAAEPPRLRLHGEDAPLARHALGRSRPRRIEAARSAAGAAIPGSRGRALPTSGRRA